MHWSLCLPLADGWILVNIGTKELLFGKRYIFKLKHLCMHNDEYFLLEIDCLFVPLSVLPTYDAFLYFHNRNFSQNTTNYVTRWNDIQTMKYDIFLTVIRSCEKYLRWKPNHD